MSDLAGSLTTEINNIRKLATEQLAIQEKRLVDRFSNQFDEVKTYMEKNIEGIRLTTDNSNDRLSTSIKRIKQVCSDYFLNYETDLEEMRIRTHVLENKYHDWSKVLIEPATLNDARLFSVEARL